MKTTAKQLQSLKEKKEQASAEYSSYLKEYNKERKIKRTCFIDEIIGLVKEGKTNQEIISLGYNKHTVKTQVRLFKKGKRVAKTVVAKFIPKKNK